jgi:hypothetical protein
MTAIAGDAVARSAPRYVRSVEALLQTRIFLDALKETAFRRGDIAALRPDEWRSHAAIYGEGLRAIAEAALYSRRTPGSTRIQWRGGVLTDEAQVAIREWFGDRVKRAARRAELLHRIDGCAGANGELRALQTFFRTGGGALATGDVPDSAAAAVEALRIGLAPSESAAGKAPFRMLIVLRSSDDLDEIRRRIAECGERGRKVSTAYIRDPHRPVCADVVFRTRVFFKKSRDLSCEGYDIVLADARARAMPGGPHSLQRLAQAARGSLVWLGEPEDCRRAHEVAMRSYTLPEQLVTTEEMCEVLGISVPTLRKVLRRLHAVPYPRRINKVGGTETNCYEWGVFRDVARTVARSYGIDFPIEVTWRDLPRDVHDTDSMRVTNGRRMHERVAEHARSLEEGRIQKPRKILRAAITATAPVTEKTLRIPDSICRVAVAEMDRTPVELVTSAQAAVALELQASQARIRLRDECGAPRNFLPASRSGGRRAGLFPMAGLGALALRFGNRLPERGAWDALPESVADSRPERRANAEHVRRMILEAAMRGGWSDAELREAARRSNRRGEWTMSPRGIWRFLDEP